MAEQYLRAINLTVTGSGGALDMSAMRIRFHTKMWTGQSPNTFQARVTNLSDSTVQRFMDKEFSEVVLDAGYESNISEIFRGTIKQTRSGQEENFVDTYLDLFCANGDLPYNFAGVNKTLAAGSTPMDVYKMCLQSMQQFGVTQGYIPTDGRMDKPKYPRAQSFMGMTKDYMRTLSHTLSCTWSIQNNKLQLMPIDGNLPGQAIEVNGATGLIGLPEQTPDGIMVKTLLNPNVYAPDTLIHLNNSSIQRAAYSLGYSGNGLGTGGLNAPEGVNAKIPALARDGIYRVLVLERVGDTRETPWYNLLTCIAAHGTGFVPKSLAPYLPDLIAD